MPRHLRRFESAPVRGRAWQRRAACALVTLALGFPGMAHPFTIQQLLRMPLEQLLQLRISPPTAHSHCAAGVCALPDRSAS
jgi:hypothetical protein